MDALIQFLFDKDMYTFELNCDKDKRDLYVKVKERIGDVTMLLYRNTRGWYYYSIELNNHTRGGATEDTLDIIKEYNDFISQEQ